MPRSRRKSKSRRELTHDQFFELWIGPGGSVSAFESPFLRRAAWHENKEELMESDGPGQRPWGFWEFEGGGQHPDSYDDETRWLRRHGLLSEGEEAQLTAIKELTRAPRRGRRRLVLEGAEGD